MQKNPTKLNAGPLNFSPYPRFEKGTQIHANFSPIHADLSPVHKNFNNTYSTHQHTPLTNLGSHMINLPLTQTPQITSFNLNPNLNHNPNP